MGDSVVSVTYVGLTYPEPDVRWDFGPWHWPEVGVELAMASGRFVFATWDTHDTQHELALLPGRASAYWQPLADGPPSGRAWDVSGHPRWAPILGAAVTGLRMSLSPYDADGVGPVALRFSTDGGAFWVAAAAPQNESAATEELDADDVWLGYDEVIVIFDDDVAERIGLIGVD